MTSKGKIVYRLDPETDSIIRKFKKQRGDKSTADTVDALVRAGAARMRALAKYAAKAPAKDTVDASA